MTTERKCVIYRSSSVGLISTSYRIRGIESGWILIEGDKDLPEDGKKVVFLVSADPKDLRIEATVCSLGREDLVALEVSTNLDPRDWAWLDSLSEDLIKIKIQNPVPAMTPTQEPDVERRTEPSTRTCDVKTPAEALAQPAATPTPEIIAIRNETLPGFDPVEGSSKSLQPPACAVRPPMPKKTPPPRQQAGLFRMAGPKRTDAPNTDVIPGRENRPKGDRTMLTGNSGDRSPQPIVLPILGGPAENAPPPNVSRGNGPPRDPPKGGSGRPPPPKPPKKRSWAWLGYVLAALLLIFLGIWGVSGISNWWNAGDIGAKPVKVHRITLDLHEDMNLSSSEVARLARENDQIVISCGIIRTTSTASVARIHPNEVKVIRGSLAETCLRSSEHGGCQISCELPAEPPPKPVKVVTKRGISKPRSAPPKPPAPVAKTGPKPEPVMPPVGFIKSDLTEWGDCDGGRLKAHDLAACCRKEFAAQPVGTLDEYKEAWGSYKTCMSQVHGGGE